MKDKTRNYAIRRVSEAPDNSAVVYAVECDADEVSAVTKPRNAPNAGRANENRGWRGLFAELRNRRVFRVAGSYVVSAWLSAQVVELIAEAIALPEWILKSYLLALAIGFPIFIASSWVYQLTSEGLKVHEDVDPDEAAQFHGRTIDYVVIGVLIVAIVLVLVTPNLNTAAVPTMPDSVHPTYPAISPRHT